MVKNTKHHPYERKSEKRIHNKMYANCVKRFIQKSKNKIPHISIHLDSNSALTTLALSSVLTKDEMKRVCVVTSNKAHYRDMVEVIEHCKIECFTEREQISKTVDDVKGIENKGYPLCVYLDFCTMLKPAELKIIDQCLKWYCFDGACFAITLSITKRQEKYPHDPNQIVEEINKIARKYNRTLKEVKGADLSRSKVGSVYGTKNMEMFFIMFNVY